MAYVVHCSWMYQGGLQSAPNLRRVVYRLVAAVAALLRRPGQARFAPSEQQVRDAGRFVLAAALRLLRPAYYFRQQWHHPDEVEKAVRESVDYVGWKDFLQAVARAPAGETVMETILVSQDRQAQGRRQVRQQVNRREHLVADGVFLPADSRPLGTGRQSNQVRHQTGERGCPCKAGQIRDEDAWLEWRLRHMVDH